MADSGRAALQKRIIETAHHAGEGHVPSALSILDIVHTLYTRVMGPDDKFALSKGHGCLALYAVLEALHWKRSAQLDNFCQPIWPLAGHPERMPLLGIEATTGSLGHGLPMAAGMALAKQIKGEPGRVFCLVGDGECEEGSIWESLHVAARLRLSNLVVIVDNNRTSPNKLDGDAFVADFAAKFTAFGWLVLTANGHDPKQLESALKPLSGMWPIALIAHTRKGNGVPEMELEPQVWHHRAPTRAMVDAA